MSFLVISTSLNPSSKSSLLARAAYDSLLKQGENADWLDLRELELPFCDGDRAYSHANVAALTARIQAASTILMSVAIYNYDCGSSAKNLVELTGAAWENKTVGFLCAAGGKSSYMSIMGLANSLMLDFRCLIVPRFVYAEGSSFKGDALADEKISARIDELVAASIKLSGAAL